MPLIAWPLLVIVCAYLVWSYMTGDVAEDDDWEWDDRGWK